MEKKLKAPKITGCSYYEDFVWCIGCKKECDHSGGFNAKEVERIELAMSKRMWSEKK
ncbi:MAG: hypothetical protein Ta2B_09530 [Termitinemataceae bacterium]|nr:MAG: hypothetical protein Ta2B_09530 [Termitinemataceae bacterium]